VSCQECRRLLNENYDDASLARKVEEAAPNCCCEPETVSDISPGPVGNDEILYRLMISPRDYDPTTRLIAQKPFEKLFANGLSVMRALGTDDDFLDIVEDGLLSKPSSPLRSVKEVCETSVSDIRGIKGSHDLQAFCVYDQTVPRNLEGASPVATHAGIFQRDIKHGVDGARKANRDLALEVYKCFVAGRVGIAGFRNHLFEDLNQRAAQGEFVTD
jgi:hypothetical protein